ncbi:MAG: hypothetical protein ACO1OF_16480 [Adhaeribacter sp.]
MKLLFAHDDNTELFKIWLLNILGVLFTQSTLQFILLLLSIIYTAIRIFKELKKPTKTHD